MKYTVFATVWISFACVGLSAERTGPGVPGLPLVPDGVNLGMDVSSLRRSRPKAKQLVTGRPRRSVETGESAKPQVYRELELVSGRSMEDMLKELATKPTFTPPRPVFAATYTFQDGRCVAISVERYSPRTKYRARREEALRTCLARFGQRLERYCRARPLAKGKTMLMPTFVWRQANRTVVLSVLADEELPSDYRCSVAIIVVKDGTALSTAMSRDLRPVPVGKTRVLFGWASRWIDARTPGTD